MTSIIIVVGFVNRDTEVLKERKGSRGYQGWTDWMPRAHWYGITLLACMASLGFPTCAVCACVPLQLPSTLLLPPSGLHFPSLPSVDTKGHPASAGPWGSRLIPLLHAKLARMFSWLPPADALKGILFMCTIPPPKASLSCSGPSLQSCSSTSLPPGRKQREVGSLDSPEDCDFSSRTPCS